MFRQFFILLLFYDFKKTVTFNFSQGSNFYQSQYDYLPKQSGKNIHGNYYRIRRRNQAIFTPAFLVPQLTMMPSRWNNIYNYIIFDNSPYVDAWHEHKIPTPSVPSSLLWLLDFWCLCSSDQVSGGLESYSLQEIKSKLFCISKNNSISVFPSNQLMATETGFQLLQASLSINLVLSKFR